MKSRKYIYLVNVTRQLSIDMINYFNGQGSEIQLITGVLEPNYAALSPDVKVTYFIKYNNSTPFKRLITWILFSIYSFFYILFLSRKKDLIIITSPPFAIFTGLIFKKIRKQNYHLIIWDLYPDVLVNFGVFKEKSFIIRGWKKLNKICFSNASNIFTIGQHLSDAIQKYTTNKPVIIQNWVDTEFIKPIRKSENPFLIKYQLENKFIVMYSGNMGITHDIESIVNTAELLISNPEIHFLIIGDGAKKARITQMVEDKKLKNVTLLPYQDKKILPYSLASADIGIVTLSEGAESVSVPSKTYYTLAAGSAIIALASLESELALLIEKYNCGKIYHKADCNAIAEFIRFLSKNEGEIESYKENSRKASLDFTPRNASLFYNYINI